MAIQFSLKSQAKENPHFPDVSREIQGGLPAVFRLIIEARKAINSKAVARKQQLQSANGRLEMAWFSNKDKKKECLVDRELPKQATTNVMEYPACFNDQSSSGQTREPWRWWWHTLIAAPYGPFLQLLCTRKVMALYVKALLVQQHHNNKNNNSRDYIASFSNSYDCTTLVKSVKAASEA